MKNVVLLLAWLSLSTFYCCAADAAGDQSTNAGKLLPFDQSDFVVLPNGTNAIQFRLYTNASPTAPHLFNAFEIEAFGKKLLQSPGAKSWQQSLRAAPTNVSLHNVLVNGLGPEMGSTNSMKIIEQASGADWCYVGLDLTSAYGRDLEQYRRSILFVAPDLFVLHDHLVGRERIRFDMFLHPPAAMQVDPVWGDLRLETPEARLRVSSPSRRELRSWEQVESAADAILPGTMTVRIGPTNQVSQLDLLTVFAMQLGTNSMDYVFKLVESNTAVGARIHRDGVPTLVAFRLDPANPEASLDSFKFTGPVGVAVLRPKRSVR